MAVGAGMFIIGIFTTVVVAVLQVCMHRILSRAEPSQTSRIQFMMSGDGEFPKRFADYISEHRIQMVESTVTREEDGSVHYDVLLRAPYNVTLSGMKYLLEDRNVNSVNCQPEA